MAAAHPAIEALLHPRSIAVIGATERRQYGGRFLANVLASRFDGPIVPVNPRRTTVMGLACVPSVRASPVPIDLAAIVIPAPAVPAALDDCRAHGVPAALVISAGFAEVGGDGERLQAAIAALAASDGPRVCGPNCLGVANVHAGLWLSANVLAPIDNRLRPGGVSVISQSGATAFGPILSLARDRGIGLRHVISSGNEADLTTADFIDYLVADRETSAIACVLEGLRDGAAFRRAIEGALAADKPVVVLKIGRSDSGTRAARSHTAALTGRDDVFDALLRQCGVARVDDWDQLLDRAAGMAQARRPCGRAVAVVSHSGGIGGLVADHCGVAGLRVPPLEPAIESRLAAILDGRGSAVNPADVTGHYAGESFPEILRLMVGSQRVDALAVATAGDADVAQRILEVADDSAKPVVVCWTAGTEETAGLAALRAGGLPVTFGALACAALLASLCRWEEARQRLDTPLPAPRDRDAWTRLSTASRNARGALSEATALGLIEHAGIAVARTIAATTVDAIDRRRVIGLRFPLAVKIDSPDLPHKSDVGGVELHIADEAALLVAVNRVVERVSSRAPAARLRGVTLQEMAPPGIEVALGVQRDPIHGPVVMLALGGTDIEAIGAAAWALPPLRAGDAAALLQTVPGLARLLAGTRRHAGGDRDALVDALVAFSAWAVDAVDFLESVEINPLVVGPPGAGITAVDCLALLPRSDHTPIWPI